MATGPSRITTSSRHHLINRAPLGTRTGRVNGVLDRNVGKVKRSHGHRRLQINGPARVNLTIHLSIGCLGAISTGLLGHTHVGVNLFNSRMSLLTGVTRGVNISVHGNGIGSALKRGRLTRYPSAYTANTSSDCFFRFTRSLFS